MVVRKRNDKEGGRRLPNQERLYSPQNLIAPHDRKPPMQKDQNVSIMNKYGHVPVAVGAGKGKTMMAVAGLYVICAISNITYSVPE